ncbi:MAG TPA: OsmC family protein [Bacteroidales bacterium]|nr:OsmC family protein [Bacteroidales bacterium]
MKDTVALRHIGKMSFDVVVNGHHLLLDTAEEFGGNNGGPRPKSLLMAALAGCTAMDVVSILNKMKIQFEEFRISIEGNVTEEHPRHYDKMHIKYIVTGNNIPGDKVKHAIELSQDKYCGVSYTLKKALDVTWELVIGEKAKMNS